MFQICETTDILILSTLGQKVFKFNSRVSVILFRTKDFILGIFPKCKSLIEINRPLISISCSSSAQILTLYDPLLPYLYVTPPAIEEGSSTFCIRPFPQSITIRPPSATMFNWRQSPVTFTVKRIVFASVSAGKSKSSPNTLLSVSLQEIKIVDKINT